MDLNAGLRQIFTDAPPVLQGPPVVLKLPADRIQKEISRLCFTGMHRQQLFSTIGKLVSAGICHDDLVANAEFFEQYISPDSGTMKNLTMIQLINQHRKDYPDQVGSRIKQPVCDDYFSDEVYENLPEEIRKLCYMIDERRKRDVFLIGMITALSAAFSRFRFYHGSGGDIKEYSPHILAINLGAPASGKGGSRYGKLAVDAVNQAAVRLRLNDAEVYKQKKWEYDRQRKERERDGKGMDDLKEPNRPTKYCFEMSAGDTSQAALVEILHHNPMGGFAYDSELDTMVQGNAKKEFGGFGDIIRKVFHHEPLNRQRKGEGESYEVPSPRLAVMLSGTHDQLKKLIPSEYNGLFSRLWYYSIPPAFIPYQIATQKTDVIGEECCKLQNEILKRADLWSGELVYMEFSPEQEQDLYRAMQDKQQVEEKHGGDISASWLRMALITKRVAVTLAGFQEAQGGIVPDNCWRAALALLPAMKVHCIYALDIVRANQGKLQLSETDYNTYKKDGMKDEEIAKMLKVSAKTLQRRKLDWTK